MSFSHVPSEDSQLQPWTQTGALAYGPVQSRRLGQSLGINLLGAQKLCSFDCPYCELGETTLRLNQAKNESFFPTPMEVEEAVRTRIRECLAEGKKIDHLTFSGNGEPTLHPEFLECVQGVLRARSDLLPDVPIVALTNGVHAENRRVVEALNLLDQCMFKIDAGNDAIYKVINKPLVRAPISKIANLARRLSTVVVQSMFVQGVVDNTETSHIEDWMEIVGIIQPKMVHIHTLARTPAIAGLKKPDEDTLYGIASRLKRKLQIEALVFP